MPYVLNIKPTLLRRTANISITLGVLTPIFFIWGFTDNLSVAALVANIPAYASWLFAWPAIFAVIRSPLRKPRITVPEDLVVVWWKRERFADRCALVSVFLGAIIPVLSMHYSPDRETHRVVSAASSYAAWVAAWPALGFGKLLAQGKTIESDKERAMEALSGREAEAIERQDQKV